MVSGRISLKAESRSQLFEKSLIQLLGGSAKRFRLKPSGSSQTCV
jgi:hypothetical protein